MTRLSDLSRIETAVLFDLLEYARVAKSVVLGTFQRLRECADIELIYRMRNSRVSSAGMILAIESRTRDVKHATSIIFLTDFRCICPQLNLKLSWSYPIVCEHNVHTSDLTRSRKKSCH